MVSEELAQSASRPQTSTSLRLHWKSRKPRVWTEHRYRWVSRIVKYVAHGANYCCEQSSSWSTRRHARRIGLLSSDFTHQRVLASLVPSRSPHFNSSTLSFTQVSAKEMGKKSKTVKVTETAIDEPLSPATGTNRIPNPFNDFSETSRDFSFDMQPIPSTEASSRRPHGPDLWNRSSVHNQRHNRDDSVSDDIADQQSSKYSAPSDRDHTWQDMAVSDYHTNMPGYANSAPGSGAMTPQSGRNSPAPFQRPGAHPLQHLNRSSTPVDGHSTPTNQSSTMLNLKYEVMVNYIHHKQCVRMWASDESGDSEGVMLRVNKGNYIACPPQLIESPFGVACAEMNVQVRPWLQVWEWSAANIDSTGCDDRQFEGDSNPAGLF